MEKITEMKEMEALRQAIEIGVKNGIYNMNDIVVLKLSLDRVEALAKIGLENQFIPSQEE